MPLPDLSKLYDGAYRFLKPVDVKPVGSYYIDCTMGPKFNVDVAVVVPKVTCVHIVVFLFIKLFIFCRFDPYHLFAGVLQEKRLFKSDLSL